MKLSIPRDENNLTIPICVLNITQKIIDLVIERFEIKLAISFGTVKIDDVTYEKFNNLSVYDSIRDIKVMTC